MHRVSTYVKTRLKGPAYPSPGSETARARRGGGSSSSRAFGALLCSVVFRLKGLSTAVRKDSTVASLAGFHSIDLAGVGRQRHFLFTLLSPVTLSIISTGSQIPLAPINKLGSFQEADDRSCGKDPKQLSTRHSMTPQAAMSNKDTNYSWHLSLRVDRPCEDCSMRPHAYMYGKKLDDREMDKPLPPHSKRCKEAPPNHEFSYRWFRGPPHEPCAYEGCPRRTSFSPHDWSMHALGGLSSSLQCVSTQSSLYKCTFCNSKCLVQAWKTQYTVPKELGLSGRTTPLHMRGASSGSFGSNVDDDVQSIDSGSSDPVIYSSSSNNNPGTPRGYVSGFSGYSGNDSGDGDVPQTEEWVEISREQVYVPGPEDVGRKMKVEAAAYSVETGELLMLRVVKTDLVLARAPDPPKRNLVTSKAGGGGGGARFRVISYNVLAEIYATQQQYPYCDFWALSWDYR